MEQQQQPEGGRGETLVSEQDGKEEGDGEVATTTKMNEGQKVRQPFLGLCQNIGNCILGSQTSLVLCV